MTPETKHRHGNAAAVADPEAREFLRKADPALARVIDAHGLDRPDVLLPGEVALRRAVERAYGLDHLPNDEEMVRLAERWRPYRSLAVSYLFASEFEKGTS
jgi:3-methyladenine DNA glycosylase/8-oxoguanine DNA glycosylase